MINYLGEIFSAPNAENEESDMHREVINQE